MQTKYALALCPEPSSEDMVMGLETALCQIRHVHFNTFVNLPSLGVVFELFPEEVTALTKRLREGGVKVGVYSSFEKAMKFMDRAFDLEGDGTLDEVEWNLGGGET